MTKEEILKPYVQIPFRRAQIVDKDDALEAMEKYAQEQNKELLRHRDTTKGLWATDRPDLIPEEIKSLFFQI
jgi:hypothetical protein